jgi:Ca2+/H+ antiporter
LSKNHAALAAHYALGLPFSTKSHAFITLKETQDTKTPTTNKKEHETFTGCRKENHLKENKTLNTSQLAE